MNDLVDISASRIVCCADERSRLLETLRYIAAHAGMACRHANALGCRSSLEHVERAARDAIAAITAEPTTGDP